MEFTTTLHCRGHPLVLSTHPTTFEVTAEDHLTANGNCIIGIGASFGCAGLPEDFRRVLAHDDTILVTRLSCGGTYVEIQSRGSSKFTLDHPTDMVWRRSSFVCGRTIGILSDHVAATLPLALVENLARGKEMEIILCATRPG
jgi:hypothetical protein